MPVVASAKSVTWALQIVVGLVFFLAPLFIDAQSGSGAPPQRLFPALFIFGDSLLDVGNNNYITTVAKSNYRPYGIDFPGGPTGRFCNGKTVLDVMGELLNLPLLPPYLAPTSKGQAILNGVNYASGAGGILQKTGYNYIGRVDFDTQLQWFGNTLSELQQLLGASAAQDLIERSLYSADFGSNDYINNYLLSSSRTSKQYTPLQFQQMLLNKYSSQLTQLYNMGARNIVVGNVGPLGCIPSQLVAQKSVNGECSVYVNNLVINFNAGLYALIQQLSANLPGSKFVYANFYEAVAAYYNNPAAYGFQFNSQACCGSGRYGAQIPCLPISKVCSTRDAYIFWDAFHPTQAVNILLGNIVYKQLLNDFS